MANVPARPTTIRIGPFQYTVRWEAVIYDCDDEGVEDRTLPTLSARVEHVRLLIRIDKTMHVVVQRKSLLHEVIHACNWITGHQDAHNEEEWVRSLAFPLLDVLRDNPRLVAWLTS